jgi:hypothetical protein
MNRKTLKELGFDTRPSESQLYLISRCIICGKKLPMERSSLICGKCEEEMHKGRDED